MLLYSALVVLLKVSCFETWRFIWGNTKLKQGAFIFSALISCLSLITL